MFCCCCGCWCSNWCSIRLEISWLGNGRELQSAGWWLSCPPLPCFLWLLQLLGFPLEQQTICWAVGWLLELWAVHWAMEGEINLLCICSMFYHEKLYMWTWVLVYFMVPSFNRSLYVNEVMWNLSFLVGGFELHLLVGMVELRWLCIGCYSSNVFKSVGASISGPKL